MAAVDARRHLQRVHPSQCPQDGRQQHKAQDQPDALGKLRRGQPAEAKKDGRREAQPQPNKQAIDAVLQGPLQAQSPTDPRQGASQFQPGQFVSCDVMDGATFTPRA